MTSCYFFEAIKRPSFIGRGTLEQARKLCAVMNCSGANAYEFAECGDDPDAISISGAIEYHDWSKHTFAYVPKTPAERCSLIETVKQYGGAR
jgi:hypothetical protein